jgi:Zinc-binding dehydrogenase
LKPGGTLIFISGPPDVAFAREQGLNWLLRQVVGALSFGIRRNAKGRRISYAFRYMRANGEQLSQITSLIEGGIIRPVIDRAFPFEATNEALAYIEAGRSKGKVVVKLRWDGVGRCKRGLEGVTEGGVARRALTDCAHSPGPRDPVHRRIAIDAERAGEPVVGVVRASRDGRDVDRPLRRAIAPGVRCAARDLHAGGP